MKYWVQNNLASNYIMLVFPMQDKYFMWPSRNPTKRIRKFSLIIISLENKSNVPPGLKSDFNFICFQMNYCFFSLSTSQRVRKFRPLHKCIVLLKKKHLPGIEKKIMIWVISCDPNVTVYAMYQCYSLQRCRQQYIKSLIVRYILSL